MTEPFRRDQLLYTSMTGLHRLSYVEWGERANPRVLVCVHGLTRNARDFDPLARALSAHYRVICPDMPGRGESSWLKNPMEYATATYINSVVTLIARLGVEAVDWVGTSMGGAIGMALASLENSPVRRMVLNEVGPVITGAALNRIGTYVGKAPTFPSFETAVQYVRTVSMFFGPHTDAEWRFLTEHYVRKQPDGGYRVHYDPRIAEPFGVGAPHKDLDLWSIWETVKCPTLVIRGGLSDLLLRDTVERMKTTGPHAEAVELRGIGHAPTLMHDDQIAIVRDFLLRG